jgi:hypothetical protein
MKNISKLLASSVVVLATSMVSAPLLADETDCFNIIIKAANVEDNTLVLTNDISAINTFDAAADQTVYQLAGNINLKGFNIKENKCKLLFSSENQTAGNFRMKSNAAEAEYINYILTANVLKSRSGNVLPEQTFSSSINKAVNIANIGTAQEGGDCSLTLSNFAITLDTAVTSGIYQDTVTITASVTS